MAKKILLADDSPTIRKVVELTFEDEGIEVHTVADGDAAMVKFVQIQPDIVIADVNMPGMSGYRLCEMIKQDETTHDIPVILLVGSFEPFDPGEASRVGSNYYFTKPFRSIRELVDKVHEFLDADGSAVSGETNDIEELYIDSLQSTDDMPGPEDDADVFAVPSEIEEPPRLDETGHFDDGATLDEILLETRSYRNAASEPNHLRAADSAIVSFEGGADPAEPDNILEWQPDKYVSETGVASGGRLDTGELDIHRTFDEAESQSRTSDTELADLEIPAADDRVTFSDSVEPAELEVDASGVGLVRNSESDRASAEAANVQEAVSAAASAFEISQPTTYGSPWEQQVAETPVRSAQAMHYAAGFGDAGMDDEIIETSHPLAVAQPADGSPAEAVFQRKPNLHPIDPFHHRVAGTAVVRAEESRGDLHGSTVMPFPSANRESIGEQPQQSIPTMGASEHVADAPELGSHVTPELIDSIVAKVLEKMSDHAVRQAAHEAVPRIAEKLIREALVDEKKD